MFVHSISHAMENNSSPARMIDLLNCGIQRRVNVWQNWPIEKFPIAWSLIQMKIDNISSWLDVTIKKYHAGIRDRAIFVRWLLIVELKKSGINFSAFLNNIFPEQYIKQKLDESVWNFNRTCSILPIYSRFGHSK